MSEDRSTLERELMRLQPARIPFDQLARRRDRKVRDQRIRAGAFALAIAVAVGWWGVHQIRWSAPVPVDEPSNDLDIFAPVAGRIVYGGNGGILGVDPAAPGGPVAQVPLASDRAQPLEWSRDGTELLIMRGASSGGALLSVLHADGSETQVTTQPMFILGATLSPDGSRVVFAGGRLGSLAGGGCCARMPLYGVDAEGGPVEVLTEPQELVYGDAYEPAFSPDGSQIVYATGGGDHEHHVWVMNADGTDAHEIVFNDSTMGGHVSNLSWSPAGDRIALGVGDGGIYTFAPDGSDFTRVIAHGRSPYWSPDGSEIAYTISCDEQPEACFARDWSPGGEAGALAIANADGSNVRMVGFGASGPWHPGPPPATVTTPT